MITNDVEHLTCVYKPFGYFLGRSVVTPLFKKQIEKSLLLFSQAHILVLTLQILGLNTPVERTVIVK